MNLRTKAILILTLLVVSLFSVVGLLHFQKRQIRKEFKTKLIACSSAEDLVHLFIPKEQLQHVLRWEHDHEFEYKGEMYDIVKTIEHEDAIEYICWWDHEETAINKKLQTLIALFKGENPDEKEKDARVLRFFKAFYFQSTIVQTAFVPLSKTFTTKLNEDLLYFLQKPPSTPPELVLI